MDIVIEDHIWERLLKVHGEGIDERIREVIYRMAFKEDGKRVKTTLPMREDQYLILKAYCLYFDVNRLEVLSSMIRGADFTEERRAAVKTYSNSEKPHTIAFQPSKEIYNRLVKLGEATNSSMSYVVERLVDEFIASGWGGLNDKHKKAIKRIWDSLAHSSVGEKSKFPTK